MSEEKFHQEEEQFDDLFRSSLGEMRTEPSPGAWNRISSSLLRSELVRFKFINMPNVFWAIVPAAVIITGVAIYLGMQSPSDPVQPVAEEVVTLVQEEGVNGVSTVNSASSVSEQETAISEATPSTTTTTTTTTTLTTTSTTITTPTSLTTPTILTSLTSLTTPTTPTIPTIPTTPSTPLTPWIPLSHSIEPIPNPVPKMPSPEPVKVPLARSFDMGINITPDMVFYSSSAGSFKYNYTFDLGARYNLGRFYIQSGAGLTYSTDIGDYAISYVKNDSVGFYYTVNSFNIEPGNPGEPQFETKEITVYDSVQYLYDYSTKNRYYYIQVPLNFGYRIINKPSWRLSVEGGLLYAYLVSISEPAPTFYIPEGRILDIERRTPQRNKHSLGLTGSISIEYQFAKDFFLLIEPTFKYYLQAIEENSSRGDKQPYSIGLRAGIWYRLNFNNKTR